MGTKNGEKSKQRGVRIKGDLIAAQHTLHAIDFHGARTKGSYPFHKEEPGKGYTHSELEERSIFTKYINQNKTSRSTKAFHRKVALLLTKLHKNNTQRVRGQRRAERS